MEDAFGPETHDNPHLSNYRDADGLGIGVYVRIVNISNAKYNLTNGKIVGFDDATQRWRVLMEEVDGSEKKLKNENLEVVMDPLASRIAKGNERKTVKQKTD